MPLEFITQNDKPLVNFYRGSKRGAPLEPPLCCALFHAGLLVLTQHANVRLSVVSGGRFYWFSLLKKTVRKHMCCQTSLVYDGRVRATIRTFPAKHTGKTLEHWLLRTFFSSMFHIEYPYIIKFSWFDRSSAVTAATNSKKSSAASCTRANFWLWSSLQLRYNELTETCLLHHNEDLIITNEDGGVEAYA